MNKYEQIPSEIIDFHGHTRRDAEIVLHELLADKRPRHIRIITGKASYRENGPVLKPFVESFLNKNGIKYRPSKIQDGGEGALEVFL